MKQGNELKKQVEAVRRLWIKSYIRHVSISAKDGTFRGDANRLIRKLRQADKIGLLDIPYNFISGTISVPNRKNLHIRYGVSESSRSPIYRVEFDVGGTYQWSKETNPTRGPNEPLTFFEADETVYIPEMNAKWLGQDLLNKRNSKLQVSTRFDKDTRTPFSQTDLGRIIEKESELRRKLGVHCMALHEYFYS